MSPNQTIGDVLVSLVRTGVAIVVGAFVSWAVRHGLSIDVASATAYVTPLAIAAYYAVVRILEARFPALGWLLGIAKAPSYAPVPLAVVVPAPEPVEPDPEPVPEPEPVVPVEPEIPVAEPEVLPDVPVAKKATKRATPAKRAAKKV